jgi:hypothetical protein
MDWEEATSSVTDKDLKADVLLVAHHVEQKKAGGILVDASHFRSPDSLGGAGMACNGDRIRMDELLRRSHEELPECVGTRTAIRQSVAREELHPLMSGREARGTEHWMESI